MAYPSKRTGPARWRGLLSLVALASCFGGPLSARAQDKRPDVHSEWVFASFPRSVEAESLFASEDTRLLLSALDRGWSVDKILEDLDKREMDLLILLDDLEEANLVRGLSDYDLKPGLVLIRETEMEELDPWVEEGAAEITAIIEDHWDDVETFVTSLEAGQDFDRGQVLYTALVGGLLWGGMIDALFDDGTLLPPPPRRAPGGDSFYAWLTEGLDPPRSVGTQSARVGRYTVFSVGTMFGEAPRIQIDDLRREGPVYEADDAGRWRVFGNVFARDYLLPYLRSRRPGLLELHRELRSSSYTAFGEFMAWYYQAVVSDVVDTLVDHGRIAPPESNFRYAIRTGR